MSAANPRPLRPGVSTLFDPPRKGSALILEGERLHAALYAVRAVVASRKLAGRPVPPPVTDLDTALQQAASAHGPQFCCDAPESKPELIGPSETARILECSTRHIRRIAADLDGHNIEGHWVFRRDTVETYAQERRDARSDCG